MVVRRLGRAAFPRPTPNAAPLNWLIFHKPTLCDRNRKFNRAGASELLKAGLSLFERLDDFLAHFFGVAEQHHCVVAVEELVVDAGVAGGHRALDEEDGLGALDV